MYRATTEIYSLSLHDALPICSRLIWSLRTFSSLLDNFMMGGDYAAWRGVGKPGDRTSAIYSSSLRFSVRLTKAIPRHTPLPPQRKLVALRNLTGEASRVTASALSPLAKT